MSQGFVSMAVFTTSSSALSWEQGNFRSPASLSFSSRWGGITVDDITQTSLSGQATDVTTLFNLHYARLVRSLTVICGNSEEAADAVQEAFVKAHLKWRKISTYDDPVGWIRRVAINKVRDGHRSKVRRDRAVERMGHQATLTAEQPAIDEVAELLSTLPKQQRAAAAMFYVEQLTVLEIADALEISEGAVKFHLHQARQKLRAHIESREEL